MLRLTIHSASATTESVIEVLQAEPAVSGLAVLPGASLQPAGDLVLANVARRLPTPSSIGCVTPACTSRGACRSRA